MADSSSSSTVEAHAATGGSSSTLQGERRPAASSLVKVQSDDAESSLYKYRLWLWTTLDVPSSSWYAQILSAILMVTIAASILNFSIGSYPQDYCGYDESSGSPVRVCSSKRLEDYPWSSQLETACIAVFTAEYVLRLLTCTTVMSVGRFICDAPNVIDLIAILPWYFILIMTEIARASGSGQNTTQGKIFGVVRIVRLTRILRVLKVSKSMKMMMVLGRTMVRSTTILLLLLLLVFIMMLFFGAFTWIAERGVYNPYLQQHLREDGSPTPFLGMGEAMYWCMTTMTTVGYGDLFPTTDFGRIMGILAMLSGTVILSLPITVIGATFSEEYTEQQRIAERQKRLAAHNLKIGVTKPKSYGTVLFGRLGGKLRKLVRRKKSEEKDDTFNVPPPNAPIAYSTPGVVECEWLLEEYRDAVVNDVKSIMAKSEADLMRMSRRVLIHSRVFTVTDDGAPVSMGLGRRGSRELMDASAVDDELSRLDDEITTPRNTVDELPNRRCRRP